MSISKTVGAENWDRVAFSAPVMRMAHIGLRLVPVRFYCQGWLVWKAEGRPEGNRLRLGCCSMSGWPGGPGQIGGHIWCDAGAWARRLWQGNVRSFRAGLENTGA